VSSSGVSLGSRHRMLVSQSALEGALIVKFMCNRVWESRALVKLVDDVESLSHHGSWRLFCKPEAIKGFDYSTSFSCRSLLIYFHSRCMSARCIRL